MKVWLLGLGMFAVGTLSVWAEKPPSAAEQANYHAVQQAVVDALNTYRTSQNVPVVSSLPVLAKAARLSAESDLFGDGSGNVFTRATDLGYKGGFGGVVLAHGYLTATQVVAGLSTSGDAALVQYLKDPDSKYVGVGLAVRASGASSDTQWYLLFGKDSANPSFPPPYDPAGVESDSGRGVPDLGRFVALYGGAVLGNSIEGFTYVDLPDAVTLQVTGIVKKLLAKPPKANGKVGAPLGVSLPSPLVKAAKIKVKGKLPPGVKFKKGKISGLPTTPGSYTIRLEVTLPFAYEGRRVILLKVRINVS